MIYIITSLALPGNPDSITGTAANGQNPQPAPATLPPPVPGPPAAPSGEGNYLKSLCREVLKKNDALREENSLLKEELNELYLEYDRMSAAFGEISHLVREAAGIQPQHSGNGKA